MSKLPNDPSDQPAEGAGSESSQADRPQGDIALLGVAVVSESTFLLEFTNETAIKKKAAVRCFLLRVLKRAATHSETDFPTVGYWLSRGRFGGALSLTVDLGSVIEGDELLLCDSSSPSILDPKTQK